MPRFYCYRTKVIPIASQIIAPWQNFWGGMNHVRLLLLHAVDIKNFVFFLYHVARYADQSFNVILRMIQRKHKDYDVMALGFFKFQKSVRSVEQGIAVLVFFYQNVVADFQSVFHRTGRNRTW